MPGGEHLPSAGIFLVMIQHKTAGKHVKQALKLQKRHSKQVNEGRNLKNLKLEAIFKEIKAILPQMINSLPCDEVEDTTINTDFPEE